MHELFKDTAAAIPVPAGLEERLLTVCRGAMPAPPVARKPIIRLLPAAAALVACGAVLAVSLATTGHLPGFGVQPPEEGPSIVGTIPGGVSLTVTQTTQSAAPSTTAQGATTQTHKSPCNTHVSFSQKTSAPTAMGGDSIIDRRQYFGIFEEMTVPQLTAHFGRRILPDRLPQDMALAQEGHKNGIYRRDEAYCEKKPLVVKKMVDAGLMRDAAITHDANTFIYQGEGDRNLTVSLSTAPYPRVWLGDMSRFDEPLTVNGTAVKLAYYDDSAYVPKASWCYSALAQTGDVEFYVTAWNLTREEFLQILENLL